MSVTISLELVCDTPGCGESFEEFHTTPEGIRKIARSRGWACGYKRGDLCPTCKNKKNKGPSDEFIDHICNQQEDE